MSGEVLDVMYVYRDERQSLPRAPQHRRPQTEIYCSEIDARVSGQGTVRAQRRSTEPSLGKTDPSITFWRR